MEYLLDSNIIIYHLNDDKIATNFITNNFQRAAISVITYYEVLAYSYNPKDRETVEKFLEIFRIIDINFSVIRKALQNLQNKKIKIADNLISATAQVNDLVLVTRNVPDYKGIDVNIHNIYKD